MIDVSGRGRTLPATSTPPSVQAQPACINITHKLPTGRCSTFANRTTLEAGGPLTIRQEPYLHTRQTFLAEVTAYPGQQWPV